MIQKGFSQIGLLIVGIIIIGVMGYWSLSIISGVPNGGKYIEGQVVDSVSGQPVNQAEIRVSNRGWGFLNKRLVWDKDYIYNSNSDQNGRFKIDYKVGPSAHLMVSKPGYQSSDEYFDNNSQVTIKLKPLNISESTDQKLTQNIVISGNYSFNISLPHGYTLKPNQDTNLERDVAKIYDEKNNQVLTIYTYASGEQSPMGSTNIDGVPFTISSYKDIQCYSDLSPTNWVPGTKPILNIQVSCDKATQDQLKTYQTIIQSLKFSPELKKVLMGKS